MHFYEFMLIYLVHFSSKKNCGNPRIRTEVPTAVPSAEFGIVALDAREGAWVLQDEDGKEASRELYMVVCG